MLGYSLSWVRGEYQQVTNRDLLLPCFGKFLIFLLAKYGTPVRHPLIFVTTPWETVWHSIDDMIPAAALVMTVVRFAAPPLPS